MSLLSHGGGLSRDLTVSGYVLLLGNAGDSESRIKGMPSISKSTQCAGLALDVGSFVASKRLRL